MNGCDFCGGEGKVRLISVAGYEDVRSCPVCDGDGFIEDAGGEIEPMWTSPEAGHTFIAGLWRVTRTPLSGHPDTPITSYDLVSEDADELATLRTQLAAEQADNARLRTALTQIDGFAMNAILTVDDEHKWMFVGIREMIRAADAPQE